MRAGVIRPGPWKRGRAAAGGIGPVVRAPLGLGVKRAPIPAVEGIHHGSWPPISLLPIAAISRTGQVLLSSASGMGPG